MRVCVLVTVLLVLLALFVIGIFLLVPLPLAVLPAILKGELHLKQNKDGTLPKSTNYWANYPATQYYDFFFFNVTNPDEVINYGAKVNVVEIGPYTYAEREFKEDITFFDNGNEVYYYNNKTWTFSPGDSCDGCKYEDVMTLPNIAYMAVLYVAKQEDFPPALVTFIDFGLLLLGEYPLRTVPMAGVLFDGYDDPLLDLVNSPLGQKIINWLGVQIPHISGMGYLVGYNHSSDGDYTSKTGKDDIGNIDLIQEWCNQTHLTWWRDDYSQDITQSGDGSYQKPGLKKTDKLKQFQSFICRAFYLHYDSETSVEGIPAYTFKMDDDTYDSTTQKNKGYRYENKEMIDYFPSWPCGVNHSYDPSQDFCIDVDCDVNENFCSTCCDGSHIHGENDTILLPPGVIPLRCFPGQLQRLPISAFLSPPHFAWSPPEVQQSVYGLSPDPNGKHHPGSFDINPMTGSSVNAHFRLQVAVPIYNEPQYCALAQTANNFIPAVWIQLRVVMDHDARNFLYLVTSTMPKVVLGVGIGFTALSILGGAVFLFLFCRGQNRKAEIRRKYDEIIEKEGSAWS